MATVTAPWWLVGVLGVLVLCGAVAVCWVVSGWAERAADWWHAWRARRRREQPRGISDDCWFGTHEDCDGCDCVCGHPAFALEELPPERTWEQMTSHQLPVVGMSPTERKDWHRLERNRKRCAGRAEAHYRAHYAAMGFEFPSGLMARVRELTP